MGTLKQYITGFVLSMALTLAAPGLLWWHEHTHHVFPTHQMLAAGFVVLALLQLVVQLIFFLHLGRESKPRWNLIMFLFALLIVTILVGGTLWIMHNLEHGQMQEVNVFTEENISPNALGN